MVLSLAPTAHGKEIPVDDVAYEWWRPCFPTGVVPFAAQWWSFKRALLGGGIEPGSFEWECDAEPPVYLELVPIEPDTSAAVAVALTKSWWQCDASFDLLAGDSGVASAQVAIELSGTETVRLHLWDDEGREIRCERIPGAEGPHEAAAETVVGQESLLDEPGQLVVVLVDSAPLCIGSSWGMLSIHGPFLVSDSDSDSDPAPVDCAALIEALGVIP